MGAYPEAANYRDAVRKYLETGRVHRLPSGKLVAKVRGYSPPLARARYRALTDEEYGDIQSVRQQLRWARRELEETGEPGAAARVAQLEATLDGLALPLRRPFTVVVGGNDPAARTP
jgi:hypothetical protein